MTLFGGLTDQEWAELAGAYEDACGEPMPTQPPLDFGFRLIELEDLIRYARDAIAKRAPINWREILGPNLHERYGVDENGRPNAVS